MHPTEAWIVPIWLRPTLTRLKQGFAAIVTV